MRENKDRISGKTMLLLLLVTAAGCLFVFHNYILGEKVLAFSDGGSDTKEQYIMWYNSIVNMLRSGGLTAWDFSNGMGASIYNINLFNPFLWVVYLAGTIFGPEKITGCMVWLLTAEIILAAQTCYLLLSTRAYEEYAKLLASFMYAFSGYLLVWGQHYALGSVMVLLPLLLYFVEKSLHSKKALFWTALMMGIIILNGYYQGYMTAVGVGLYVTIRTLLFNEGPMRQKLKQFVSIALSMTFGLFIGMINLLPSLFTIRTSERLSTDSSVVERIIEGLRLWDREYLRTALYRLFGTNLQGQGNYFVGYRNYYEAVQLFFSILFFILLVQYVLTIHRRKLSVRQKGCLYLGVVICLFSVVVQTGSLPFNAFQYAFTRHVFLMLPFWAMMSAQVLTQIFAEGVYSRAGLVIAGAVDAVLYVRAYQNYTEADYQTNALVLGVCAVTSVIILWQVCRNKLDRKTGWLLLGGTLFLSTMSDASLTVRYRPSVSKLDTEYYLETYSSESDTVQALNWISQQDDGWYRIEKDYTTAAVYLEAMAQEYEGVSTYNSTQTGGSLNFIDKLWPQMLTGYDVNHNDFRNSVHEEVMASLTGVKYLLSLYDTVPAAGYERIHQIGEVYIYQNCAVDSPVHFYTQTVNEAVFEQQADSIDLWNLLPDVLITDIETDSQLTEAELEECAAEEIKGVVMPTEVECDRLFYASDGAGYDFIGTGSIPLEAEKLEGYARVWISFTLESDSSAPLTIYTGDERGKPYLNKESSQQLMELPAGTQELRIETLDRVEPYTIRNLRFYGSKAVTDFSDREDTAQITVTKQALESAVSGTVDAEESGWVLLTIPYQDGWEVTVDGEAVDITAGDYAFIAFPVSAGTHTFRASYHIPLFTVSKNITILSVLIWLAGLLIFSYAAPKGRREKTE